VRAWVALAVTGSVVAGSALIGVSPSSAATASGADVITTVAGGGTSTAVTNGIASTAASLGSPLSAVLDQYGNAVFADQNNNVIRVAAATTGTFYNVAMTAGHTYTVVGDPSNTTGDDSGAALSVSLSDPNGVAVDAAGDIAITDTDNDAVLFDPAASGTYFGQPMTAHVVYPIAGDLDPNGAISTYAFNAGLSSPDGIAFDAQGDVVVADTGNYIIRIIPRTAHTAFGQAMQPFSIYTIAGNTNYGYSGNGGPAVDAELGLDTFNGVAVDPRGDVVFSDVDNNVVRLVAASSGSAYGRSVTADDIYTIAGTSRAGFKGDKKPAAKAWLNTPQGVAIDAAGNLFITDSANNRIRLVSGAKGTYDGVAVKAGDIYSVAGNGGTGDTGNGGPATSAELNTPTGVSVGLTGGLLVADNGNNVIREITGTPPGQPTVSAIKPTSGPITGDRKVSISGANLTGTTAVMFGARAALRFTVKSAKKIIAYSPTSTLGTVVIKVYSPTGVSTVSAVDAYTYQAASAAKKHGRRR
jgi:sugar lactone lactonase YvrE